jgi:hypothetical protein
VWQRAALSSDCPVAQMCMCIYCRLLQALQQEGITSAAIQSILDDCDRDNDRQGLLGYLAGSITCVTMVPLALPTCESFAFSSSEDLHLGTFKHVDSLSHSLWSQPLVGCLHCHDAPLLVRANCVGILPHQTLTALSAPQPGLHLPWLLPWRVQAHRLRGVLPGDAD